MERYIFRNRELKWARRNGRGIRSVLRVEEFGRVRTAAHRILGCGQGNYNRLVRDLERFAARGGLVGVFFGQGIQMGIRSIQRIEGFNRVRMAVHRIRAGCGQEIIIGFIHCARNIEGVFKRLPHVSIRCLRLHVSASDTSA